MGFLGFLKFALKCFDFLAWPLFALGFPLYASIRAIETNSYSDMRNLVAYWILFSLISLFELAFVILIDWLPFWPYMKLLAVCWLVLPHFNGAAYVYECLLRPCLSVDLRVVLKHFIKPKEDKTLSAESFLAVVERYVQENGSEALEKLLDRKHTRPEIDVEEIEAVTTTAGKETAAPTLSKFKEPPVAKEDTGALELTEKNPVAATEWVKCIDPTPAQTEKKTVAAGEIKGKTVAAAGRGSEVMEITASEKVQKEWTCAVCQLTTTCEKNLNMHLHGGEHKARCEELKASKQVTKNKVCSSSAANQVPKKPVHIDRPNQSKPKKQEDKVQAKWVPEHSKGREVRNTGFGMNQSSFWCSLCDVKCTGESDLASHFGGNEHLLQLQRHMALQQHMALQHMAYSFGGYY